MNKKERYWKIAFIFSCFILMITILITVINKMSNNYLISTNPNSTYLSDIKEKDHYFGEKIINGKSYYFFFISYLYNDNPTIGTYSNTQIHNYIKNLEKENPDELNEIKETTDQQIVEMLSYLEYSKDLDTIDVESYINTYKTQLTTEAQTNNLQLNEYLQRLYDVSSFDELIPILSDYYKYYDVKNNYIHDMFLNSGDFENEYNKNPYFFDDFYISTIEYNFSPEDSDEFKTSIIDDFLQTSTEIDSIDAVTAAIESLSQKYQDRNSDVESFFSYSHNPEASIPYNMLSLASSEIVEWIIDSTTKKDSCKAFVNNDNDGVTIVYFQDRVKPTDLTFNCNIYDITLKNTDMDNFNLIYADFENNINNNQALEEVNSQEEVIEYIDNKMGSYDVEYDTTILKMTNKEQIDISYTTKLDDIKNSFFTTNDFAFNISIINLTSRGIEVFKLRVLDYLVEKEQSEIIEQYSAKFKP